MNVMSVNNIYTQGALRLQLFGIEELSLVVTLET